MTTESIEALAATLRIQTEVFNKEIDKLHKHLHDVEVSLDKLNRSFLEHILAKKPQEEMKIAFSNRIFDIIYKLATAAALLYLGIKT